jgi:hypothetical protein
LCSICCPCTHQDDMRLRAKHFATMADRFLQSQFVFDPSSCSGLQALPGRKPHLSQSPSEKVEGGQIWRSRRPGSGRQIHRPGNCLFKNVVTSLWAAVALRHVERLVCLEAAGAINGNPNTSRYMSPSYVCAILYWQELKLLLTHACNMVTL